MTTLDYSIVTGYLLMMLALGGYAQFQQSNTEDYYVGGRRLSTLSIAVLWMASWVGGASVIGCAVLLLPEPFLALARAEPVVAEKVRDYLRGLAFALPANATATYCKRKMPAATERLGEVAQVWEAE